MTPVKDDKESNEEPTVQVLSDDDSEVEEANDDGKDVTGDDGEEDEEDEDEDVDDEDDDEDDEEEDEDEEEEDLGTEYLVRPIGEAEEEEDASDFDPEDNGVEEDIEEEDEEEDEADDINNLSAGKSDPLSKRKRVAKDQNEQEGVTGDDIRPSKR